MSEINVTRTQDVPENQETIPNNNQAHVAGVIEYDLRYSHEAINRNFYETKLIVKRLSGVDDHIPIIISEELKDTISGELLKGMFAEIEGNIRVYKRKGIDGRRHTHLYLYVSKINLYESALPIKGNNRIYLEGNIVKKPISNEKLTSGKIFTILIVAVNRYHNVFDRIPCLAWNNLSESVANLKAGSRIKIEGRLESRIFLPKNGKEYQETYQVSVRRVIID